MRPGTNFVIRTSFGFEFEVPLNLLSRSQSPHSATTRMTFVEAKVQAPAQAPYTLKFVQTRAKNLNLDALNRNEF